MVQRRVLLNGSWKAFERSIRCTARAVKPQYAQRRWLEFEEAARPKAICCIGADGLPSDGSRRRRCGTPEANGACMLARDCPSLFHTAQTNTSRRWLREHGNVACGRRGFGVQCGSTCNGHQDFVRPRRPIDMIRANSKDGRLGVSGTRNNMTARIWPLAVPAFSASIPARPGGCTCSAMPHTRCAPLLRRATNQAMPRHDGVCQGAIGFRRAAKGS